MERKALSLLCLMILCPGLSVAKVKLSKAKPIQIPINEVDQPITSKDIQKLIPLDLKPSEDAGYVAGRVGDRAFQLWMKSPAMQNSSIGRTATQVEQSMKTEMDLADTGEGSESVNHKIGFSILALQAVARMTYTGWVNAELNHDARAKATVFQISEKVWNNKDITLSHTANSDQGLSALGLRWSF